LELNKELQNGPPWIIFNIGFAVLPILMAATESQNTQGI
jgi:hypothetical protein